MATTRNDLGTTAELRAHQNKIPKKGPLKESLKLGHEIDWSIRDTEGISEVEKTGILTVKRLLFQFGDGSGLIGPSEHLGDESSRWRDLVLVVVVEFTTNDPRQLFSTWDEVTSALEMSTRR